MKKIFTYLFVALLTGTLCTYGQSTLLIEEDFQDWEPTEDTDPADCEAGLVHEAENVRQLELTVTEGTVDIDVTLIKAGIAPDCDTKRFERDGTPSTEGVSVGYVSLSKTELETDTIGQFIFGPIHQIDSIRFAHSATGSNRGIRIYKSSDGETWERATDNEFNDSPDSQAGDIHTVAIDATNVYIKFTSGVDQTAPDPVSQHSRLHDLWVWGEPGGGYVGVESLQQDELTICPIGSGLFRIEGDCAALVIYNTVGAVVYSQTGNNLSTLDLSGVPKGVYIVQAKDRSGQLFVKKILNN